MQSLGDGVQNVDLILLVCKCHSCFLRNKLLFWSEDEKTSN